MKFTKKDLNNLIKETISNSLLNEEIEIDDKPVYVIYRIWGSQLLSSLDNYFDSSKWEWERLTYPPNNKSSLPNQTAINLGSAYLFKTKKSAMEVARNMATHWKGEGVPASRRALKVFELDKRIRIDYLIEDESDVIL